MFILHNGNANLAQILAFDHALVNPHCVRKDRDLAAGRAGDNRLVSFHADIDHNPRKATVGIVIVGIVIGYKRQEQPARPELVDDNRGIGSSGFMHARNRIVNLGCVKPVQAQNLLGGIE